MSNGSGVRSVVPPGLVLLGGAYAVARQAGVIDPASGPLDPLVAAVGALPGEVRLVVAALLGTIGGLCLWLAIRAVFWLPVALVRLHGSNGVSSVFFMLAIAGGVLLVTFLVAGALLVGDTGSLWEGEGVSGSADEVQDEELPSIDVSIDGDSISPPSLPESSTGCSQPGGTDSDGDRLPDQWEENGRTPDGAPLPGADPDRKDIYIQPIYEQGAERFTAAEKRQLRQVWDRMPVDNPGGESGVALHFVDQVPDDGRIDDSITVGSNMQSIRSQYYNEGTLGAGVCRYHLVAVGTVTGGSSIGKGEAPGYVTVIDSTRRPSYEGSVSLRVAITTHELLHNVVGRVNGGYHTSSGWLSPRAGPDSEHLTSETEAELDAGFASR